MHKILGYLSHLHIWQVTMVCDCINRVFQTNKKTEVYMCLNYKKSKHFPIGNCIVEIVVTSKKLHHWARNTLSCPSIFISKHHYLHSHVRPLSEKWRRMSSEVFEQRVSSIVLFMRPVLCCASGNITGTTLLKLQHLKWREFSASLLHHIT